MSSSRERESAHAAARIHHAPFPSGLLDPSAMDLRERPDGAGGRRHPWERARARFFARLVSRALARGPTPPGPLLDVGGGDGFFARTVADAVPGLEVVCWDPGYEDPAVDLAGLEEAVGPRVRLAASPPARHFPALTLLDVLEHVPDDDAFLRRVLAERGSPGAVVVVSVPAWPALYAQHDLRLRHHRRYHPRAIRSLLGGAGIEVRASGGLFASLLPLRLVQTFRERLAGRGVRPSDLGPREDALPPPPPLRFDGPAPLAWAAEALLDADARTAEALGRAPWSLPGLSFWAVGRWSGGGHG